MDLFTFKIKNAVWQYVLGIFAVVAGFISLFSDIKGLVPLFIGGYLLIQNGVEVNFSNNTYRSIKSIFGLKLGKWEALPDIDYISVFKTTEVTTVWARTASANISKGVFKVNLFYNTNQKIEAYITEDMTDAFEKATLMSSKLHIDILDATTRDPNWL
ncbi:MAG: hypothetical protein AB8B52_06600 [Winogradskyella sp.]|uniref:hypothetical protein n=1 Tax=Winogradskyella sp. TaxID=1883156 RepID=UPI00385DFE5D